MKKKTKILIGIFTIIGIVMIGFFIWAMDTYKPMIEAKNALQSNDEITIINNNGHIIFKNNDIDMKTGFIFYPGAKVEPESYSVLARTIAESGYLVIIVRFPLNLAFFQSGVALSLVDEFLEISCWFIGGHSLGGSMAAKAVYDNPNVFEGLILLASYPANNNNLKDYNLQSLTIYGELDGVLSKNIEDTLHLLPESTQVELIEGGNHEYFGYYGEQSGDNQASITREQQHHITTSLIINFIG